VLTERRCQLSVGDPAPVEEYLAVESLGASDLE
jgi:hypothetical protein